MGADEKGPTDWSKTNASIQKHRIESQHPLDSSRPALNLPAGLQAAGSGIAPAGEAAPPAITNPEGLLAKFKVGAVTRGAAVQGARLWHAKQLEAMEHRLTEVVRVRNAESTTIAEQMLASINEQHLAFLTEIGLRDSKLRTDALARLTDETAASLADAEKRDWPEALRAQFVGGLLRRHSAFFDKLSTELGA